MRRRTILTGLSLAAVGVAVFFAGAFVNRSISYGTAASALSSGEFVRDLRACLTNREAVVTCAPSLIEKEMQERSAAEAMQTLSDSFSTRECHVMGHTVGQLAYKKTGSVEKALGECGLTCGAACIHGAIGQAFVAVSGLSTEDIDLEHLNADDIRTHGKSLCTTVDTCHGVGHILFQVKNEIREPLAICEEITSGVKRQSCFTGVFMENADVVSSHNILLGTRKIQTRDNEDLAYPCNAVLKEARHACLRYQSRVQAQIFNEKGIVDGAEKYEKRVQACETFSDEKDRTDCFEGMGFSAYTLIQNDPAGARRFCGQFPRPRDRAACMLGMTFWAANFGQVDASLSFCESVQDEYERNVCYHGAFETVVANGEPQESVGRYCENHDKKLCLAGYKAYLADPWSQLFGVPVTDNE